MTNIVRRNEERGVATPSVSWDPFRLMDEMLSWEPFRGGTAPTRRFWPQFEVKETPDAYVFRADLPGVDEKDVEVNLTGDRLTISGKREAEKRAEGDTYFAYECSYGDFTRSFTLPAGIDSEHVEGELKNGVLTIHLPKTPEMKPKKISLKGVVQKIKSLGSSEKAKA